MSARDYIDRFTGRSEDRENSSGGGLFGSDVGLFLGLLFTIYVAFILVGTALGYGVNGQANALQRVTLLTAVYALVVLALNLHWGYTGLFNIGVAGFLAVGTYTMAMATAPVDARVPGLGLPFGVGVLLGMVAAAIVGGIAALPALRLRADYFAIVTIALSEIIRITYLSSTFQEFTLFGAQLGTGGGGGIGIARDPDTVVVGWFRSVPGLDVAVGAFSSALSAIGVQPSVINGWIYALTLLGVVLAYYWFLQRVGHSPFGRVLKAIRDDEDVARALGKDTRLFKIKSFMVGCALIGLAGVLWMGRTGFVNPNTFRPQVTFFVWIALIIGGAGSNTGSVLGSALFAALLFELPRYLGEIVSSTVQFTENPSTFAEAVGVLVNGQPTGFLAYIVNNIAPLRLVLVGIVLIWLMQNRPEGLFGHRKEIASSVDLSRRDSESTSTRTTAESGGDAK